MPRFRPIPPPLGRPRVTPVRAYARFYAQYKKDLSGIPHRASYQVTVDRYSPRMKYHWVAVTCQRMKKGYIPQHYSGQVFGSFSELFSVPWIRIRKLIKYTAGVEYVR
jgi:hypothetical protein